MNLMTNQGDKNSTSQIPCSVICQTDYLTSHPITLRSTLHSSARLNYMEQPVPRLERNTDASGVRKQHPRLQGPGVQINGGCGLQVQLVPGAG